MHHEYVLAFDVGTSSVKGVVVDLDGNLISTATGSLILHSPQRDWKEQDPMELWQRTCECAKSALQKAGRPLTNLKGIVFGTFWKGIIPMDADGRLLSRNILWCDGRGGKQAAELNEALGTDYMCSIEYWPRLKWFKDEMPEAYAQAEWILETNAFLKYKATGTVTSDYNNNYLRTTNRNLQKRYDRVIEAIDLDMNKFPPLMQSTEQIGVTSAQGAEELGVLPGIPVFGGTTDLASIAIGSGCAGLMQAHIYLGSSGWMGTALPVDPTGKQQFLPFYEGVELALFGMQSGGMSFDWGARTFYGAGPKTSDEIMQTITCEVEQVPPGSDGLLCIPWIHGEKPPYDTNARCTFFRAEASHTRANFQAAIIEGICYQLRHSMESLQEAGLPSIDVFRAVGGCTNNDSWMQRLADILKTPVHVPTATQHAGAVGVAYCALIGLGVCQSYAQARDMVKIEKVFEPKEENLAVYDRMYPIWCKLQQSLKECNALLAE